MNGKALLVGFLVCFTSVVWSQTPQVSPELKQKVQVAASKLTTTETHAMDPVAVNATLVWSADKTQVAVVMKGAIEVGWHIYAYVPETEPYIATDLRLELPKGVSALGDWVLPTSKPYENGIYVYEDEVLFVQYCTVDTTIGNVSIKSGLYYQTCDIHKCFPPTTKSIELKLNN